MSSMIVKALWPGERAEDLATFRNSWGGAALVWQIFVKHYLKSDMVFFDDIDRVWPLSEDPSINKAHRAVLMMTYDNAYIAQPDYARAAQDIRIFLRDFPADAGVNHWEALAQLFESNPACPAIGFHWTTVNCDPWTGPWDEEKDEELPFDWSPTWNMYQSLDSTP